MFDKEEIMDDSNNLLIEELQSKSGHINLKINGVYIHSNLDPVLEAQEVVKNSTIKNDKEFLLFGLGAGHILDQLLKTSSEQTTIHVIEPFTELINSYKSKSENWKKNVIFHSPSNIQNLFYNQSFIEFLNLKPSIIKVETIYEMKRDYFANFLKFRASNKISDFREILISKIADSIEIQHDSSTVSEYCDYIRKEEKHVTKDHFLFLAFNKITSTSQDSSCKS